MECEGEVSFTFWSKDSGRSKTRIIDKDRIRITFPVDTIWRIGYYRIKRLFIPVFWMRESITVCYIEFLIVDVVEKHIDTTEIVGGDIDFLSEKSLTDIFFSEDLRELEEERARSTAWIIDFVYLRFSYGCDLCEEFAHFLRREEFTSRFSGI
jgi:hypothetical protein